MSLLERVSTLLRANLNDLVEKAEDPERMLKQVVLDMENQLMQVKTQVAIAIADQHLLTKRHKEHLDAMADWRRKAELAIEKQKEDLARAAVEKSLQSERLAEGFAQQIGDQAQETELLRSAYSRLERKLAETRACEILAAQNRRAKSTGKANAARGGVLDQHRSAVARLKDSVERMQAENAANHMLLESGDIDDRIEEMERDERVTRLLAELKQSRARLE